jgi:ABC-2 type transport system ATP-binding protein
MPEQPRGLPVTSSAIEVRNLSKQFGPVHAVNGVSFTVARGDVLGFLGPNGAGKSTTMKMITGFLEPSGGTASVCGFDVAQNPIELKSKVGYLPEGAPLYGEMTVAAFLDFVAEVRGLTARARVERIAEVVRIIELRSVLRQRIETLSKGFKRRVGLAQAILHDPEVLILDEPTDGLDPNQKHHVRSLIKRMAADKAIVISTHILEEVDAVCNKVIIIADGRLVFAGTPRELESRSRFHNAVSLAITSGDAPQARAALGAIAGVGEVRDDGEAGDALRLLVLPRDGASIIGEVSETIRARGWSVAELRVEAGRLDEVFRAITGGAAEETGA